ncbi:cobalamin biosynthesis protein [Nocardia sp. NPDC056064]|uniref:cobalamin biosynthesis protein n=1 Tax=Nocardia sp. NPDC056064 TaxID=3345701 RepID=UPI0035DBB6EC
MAVGIGLRPGTGAAHILRAIRSVITDARIVVVATLDRRAEDTGLRAAAETLAVPLVTFTPDRLAGVEVRHRSDRTMRAIGAAGVAEAAALLAGGELVCARTVVDGIVVAAATAREGRN